MSKRVLMFATVPALFFAAAAGAQHPVLDMLANNVIQKYQHASCEQLWEKRREPKSQDEREMIEMLRGDPQMRTMFIDKIAAPVANKMFECGMLP